MLKKVVFTIIAILCIPMFSYAYDLYVQSVKAPIYLAPDINSGKIAEVKKGTRIIGLKDKGYWHKVDVNGKKGWVYKFMVKKEPPMNQKSLYSRLKSIFRKYEVAGKSRRRPSSYTATAAARGLKDNRKRFADKYSLDYSALEKVESIEISDNEAMEFLTQRGRK